MTDVAGLIARRDNADETQGDADETQGGDRGAILVMVLVLGVIGTLFVLPMLYYVSTVSRASGVPTDKAESVELAEGGTWVALSNQADLYDLCVGGELVSSLDGVTTTCDVIGSETQYEPTEVPFHIAAIQADEQVPGAFGGSGYYTNPNTTADPAAWLAVPDWSSVATAGTVWTPELPVRATSDGGQRDTEMESGTQAAGYPSCRVFFPGSFFDEIVLDGPTYFASGVYYFTEPIILRAGADVVAGNGSELGCTTDAESIGGAETLPNPLNMSGLGATFVLGDSARIEIDDDGSDDIRFVMNQRYVPSDETSIAASDGVSIVSVNGTHAPFAAGETIGDPLVVPGEIALHASTIGIDGSPLAADNGYLPSRLTPKASEPEPPVITSAVSHQRDRSGNGGPSDRGRVTVFWDAPGDNGAPITGYTVVDATSGRTCSPATQPGYEVQTTCTINGLTNQSNGSGLHPELTVVATNAVGDSEPSTTFDADRIDLGGSAQVPSAGVPDKPNDALLTIHPDGLYVSWTTPPDDGGSPITGYRVLVTDTVDTANYSCDAWWNELSCAIPVASGTTPDPVRYVVTIAALQHEGDPITEFVGDAEDVDSGDVTTSTDPLPSIPPIMSTVERTAILDFTVENGAQVDVAISGYVAVPAGRVALASPSPTTSSVAMTGGLVAGQFTLDPAGVPALDIGFDNPIAQKRIRLVSVADVDYTATSTAIVQVNRSGSIAINSWIVQ